MPITESILGGAAGGIGGAAVGEGLKPIFGKMTDWHRIVLLLIIVGAIIGWYLVIPKRRRRRAP